MNDVPSTLAASWALAWIGEHRLLARPPEPEMLLSLFRVLHGLEFKEQARYSAWALSAQALLDRDTFSKEAWGDCDAFLRQAVTDKERRWRHIRRCALVVAWYRRSPWSDLELVDQASKYLEEFPDQIDLKVRKLLENLGDAGRGIIAGWERRHDEPRTARGRLKQRKP